MSDFVEYALAQIPTYFGKLALLADLRDETRGRYIDSLAYLAPDEEGQLTRVEQWIRERLFEQMIPASTPAVERSLFLSDPWLSCCFFTLDFALPRGCLGE